MSSSLLHQCLIFATITLILFDTAPALAVVIGQTLPSQHRNVPQDAAQNWCPTKCDCKVLFEVAILTTIANCQNQELTTVPEGIPKNTVHLFLSSNHITSITQNDLRDLDILRALFLSGNSLSELDEKTFTGLRNLTYLDLSSNRLKSNLPVEVFGQLNALQELNLSSNSFTHISNYRFYGLRNLKRLDISANNIAGMDREALKDLELLEYLDFSFNRLSTLEHAWFLNLQNLKYLNLKHNKLSRIGNTVFSSLKSLLTLDLSQNVITAIGYLSFRGLVQVTSLNLSSNNFTVLQEGTLKPMENLQQLNLSNTPLATFDGFFKSSSRLESLYMQNMFKLETITRDSLKGLSGLKHFHLVASRISKIDSYAFEHLNSLEVLDLRANRLTSLPRNLFSNLNAIKLIQLKENPWDCNCMLFWLLHWLGDNSKCHIMSPEDTVCNFPEALSGIPILDALDHHMICISANISKHSPQSAFKLGSSATLICKPSGFPEPTLSWVTPGNLMFHWSNHIRNRTHDLNSYITNSEHRLAHDKNHEAVDSQSLNRFSLLENGSLVIQNIQRGDNGIYRCIVSNALKNTTVLIPVGIDLQFRFEIQIMSILVGMATSFGFLMLTLFVIMLAMILEHFGVECPCLTISPRAKQIRKMLESMETYKTQQLDWLKDNYTCQAQRIKDNCMQQMERLRESYSCQVERLRDIRDYGTQQIDRIRDNYFMQVQRVRDYSTSQIDRLRENYVFQRNRVRKFSAHQFIKLRENYKVQQQHLNKILENLNLESCKSNCNRTDSMIFEPEMLAVDSAVFHMPALGLKRSSGYRDTTETESQLSDYYTPEDARSVVSGENYEKRERSWVEKEKPVAVHMPKTKDVGVSTSDLQLQVEAQKEATGDCQLATGDCQLAISKQALSTSLLTESNETEV